MSAELAASHDQGGGPVIVIAAARSGSTLLRFILDSHPVLACPPELNFGELCERVYQAAYFLTSAHDPKERATQSRAILRNTVNTIFEQYLTRTGKSRWCEKSLDSVDAAPLISDAWEDSSFVILHRHCMDVVWSGLKLSAHGLRSHGYGKYAARYPGNSVAALVAYWIEFTTSALHLEKSLGSRALSITYEALVSEPSTTCEKIWRFLDIDALPEVRRTPFQTRHDDGPSDHKIWHTREIHAQSVGLGRYVPLSLIPPALVRRAEALLGELGYISLEEALLSARSLEPSLRRTVDPHPTAAVAPGLHVAATRGANCDRTLDVAWSDDLVRGTSYAMELPPTGIHVVAELNTFRAVAQEFVDVSEAARRGDVKFLDGFGSATIEHDTVERILTRVLAAERDWLG